MYIVQRIKESTPGKRASRRVVVDLQWKVRIMENKKVQSALVSSRLQKRFEAVTPDGNGMETIARMLQIEKIQ